MPAVTATDVEPVDFSISEAAALTGLSVHTLRYYERAGLMRDVVPRAASTHRRYRHHDIGWAQFIARLRSTGMPIREIKRYAELARSGGGRDDELLSLLEAHKARVEEQLRDVQQHLAAIDFKIAIYRDRSAGA